jgi:hypothetical protein
VHDALNRRRVGAPAAGRSTPMIRQNKSSPCYDKQHDQCRLHYVGLTKRYNADEAKFYHENVDFTCTCTCHKPAGGG